jgi:hypothetical protein
MSAVFEANDVAMSGVDKSQSERGVKAMTSSRMSDRERHKRLLQVEYRVLQVITFPVFLLIALLTFMLPRAVRSTLPGLDVEGSLLARTRSLAGNSIPFVFMG